MEVIRKFGVENPEDENVGAPDNTNRLVAVMTETTGAFFTVIAMPRGGSRCAIADTLTGMMHPVRAIAAPPRDLHANSWC